MRCKVLYRPRSTWWSHGAHGFASSLPSSSSLAAASREEAPVEVLQGGNRSPTSLRREAAQRALFARLESKLRGGKAEVEQVGEIIAELRRRALLQDPRRRAAVVSSLSKARLWRQSLALLQDEQLQGEEKESSRSLYALNASISAAEKGQQWALALASWMAARRSGAEVDVVTHTAAINACEKGRLWAYAVSLLRDMERQGMQSDLVAYNALVSACEKGKAWQSALELFTEMRVGEMEADSVVYGSLVRVCHAVRRWGSSLAFFAEMQARALSPSPFTLDAAMLACASGERLTWAMDMLEEMRQQHLQPSPANYTAAIDACRFSQAWEWALALLATVAEPNVMAFNAFCGVCLEAREWRHALIAMTDLCEQQLGPTAETYKAVIGTTAHAQQWPRAWLLLQRFGGEVAQQRRSATDTFEDQLRLQQLQLGLVVQGGLVSRACEEASAWQVALQLVQEAREAGTAAPEWLEVLHWRAALAELERLACSGAHRDWTTYLAVIHALLEAGRHSEARALLREAQEADVARVDS